MRTLIVVLCLTFVAPVTALAQVEGEASSKSEDVSAERRAWFRTMKRLNWLQKQADSSRRTLVRHTNRIDRTQGGVRANRSALREVANAHRAVKQQIADLPKTFTTLKQYHALKRRADLIEGSLETVNKALIGVNRKITTIEAGRFTRAMSLSINRIAEGVLEKYNVLKRLRALEDGQVIATADRASIRKQLVRVGFGSRFTIWSANRDSMTSGVTVSPSLCIPLGKSGSYGNVCGSAGIGYGGAYGDHSTMLVDATVGYRHVVASGLLVEAGFYYGSTHAFTEINEDVSPTISQFIGARALVGWDFTYGFVGAGVVVGDDGHIDTGHDVSVGPTFELQFSF